MFSIEETEAIVLALAMVARTGDTELRQAAKKVSDKIAASLPDPLSKTLSANALHAWAASRPHPPESILPWSGGRCATRSGWT